MDDSRTIYNAFTTQNTNLTNQLINEATVIFENSSLTAKALWDTGATGTCISTEVAKRLSLPIAGFTQINTPSGRKTVNKYVIDIELPNGVRIKDVSVCDSDIGEQGIDVLLGMDIITLGDFAVSNYNGKTVFTFRIPSKKKTDYVQEINIENVIGPKHGRGKRKRH